MMLKRFFMEEDAVGTVEMILILVEIYTRYKSVFNVFNNKNKGIISTVNTLTNDGCILCY